METGKNRFFNICEAYQSMLGKSDSISSDARRYRMVSESSEQSRAMHPRAKDVSESYDVEAYENVYIGRTDDYYSEEEDDGVYSKPTWTWSEDANDKDFAKEGPVYKLTDDGKRDFFEWLDAYQVGYSLGSGRMLHGRNESPEEEWDSLTNPGNGLSTEVVGSGVADESVLEKSSNRNEVQLGKPVNEDWASDMMSDDIGDDEKFPVETHGDAINELEDEIEKAWVSLEAHGADVDRIMEMVQNYIKLYELEPERAKNMLGA